MHWKRGAVWLVRLAAAALTPSHANPIHTAEAANTKTLFCRGGKGKHQVSWALAAAGVHSKHNLQTSSVFFFKKSKKKYGADTLKAGECAWTDRAMSSRDPNRLVHTAMIGSPKTQVKLTTVRNGPDRFSVTHKGKSALNRPAWGYFDALNLNGKLLELEVVAAKGQLKVRKVRAIHNKW